MSVPSATRSSPQICKRRTRGARHARTRSTLSVCTGGSRAVTRAHVLCAGTTLSMCRRDRGIYDGMEAFNT